MGTDCKSALSGCKSARSGCESGAAIILQCSLADATFEKPMLGMYPNPVSSLLTVDSPNAVSIVIYDAFGHKIIAGNLTGGLADTSNRAAYSTGIYFVKAISESKTEIYKIIKL